MAATPANASSPTRCPMTGTQAPAQREPGTPITCPSCGHPVTLKQDEGSGDTYFPTHGPNPGSYGLYVAHHTGGHINLMPWSRFATRDDANLAAHTYQAGRGPARQQSFGPVTVKAYPNDAPTMTFDQWLAGGRNSPNN